MVAKLPNKTAPRENAVTRSTRGVLALIEKGRLAGGQSLNELELAERLQVARSTLREALARLEIRGIAVRARGRGLVVRRLDRRDVSDLYELREHLEALAARRAAERFSQSSPAQATQLAEARRQWRAAAKDRSLPAFSDLNREFHQWVISAAGNRHLPDMLDRTLMMLFTAQFRNWLVPTHLEQAAQEHLAILDAIEAGDGRAAESAMRRHVRSSAGAMLSLPDDLFD